MRESAASIAAATTAAATIGEATTGAATTDAATTDAATTDAAKTDAARVSAVAMIVRSYGRSIENASTSCECACPLSVGEDRRSLATWVRYGSLEGP